MNKITVDTELCIGCKICYKACFIDVIRWDEKENRPVSAYPEDCVACMYCQAHCPKGAIKVEIDFDNMRDWHFLPNDGRYDC